MDNLCHTLVGAAMGEAGLKRRAGLSMATLMIGANLPDVDVLAIPFGESLPFRRGWTHGPLAWVVLPVVLAALVVGWDRLQQRRGTRPPDRLPVRFAPVLGLAAASVLSHPFFDWLNSYGIRLLMPFSDRWFYGDAVFIIDPWIWLALGAGVLLARRRDRSGAPAWPRPARFALAAVGVYVAALVASSALAERLAAAEIEQAAGVRPARVMAGPLPLDPRRRQLVFELGEGYGTGEVAWGATPRVRLAPTLTPRLDRHPAALAARRHEPIADFLVWSRFPFFVIDPEPGGAWVRVADARYTSRRGGGWATERVWIPDAEMR